MGSPEATRFAEFLESLSARIGASDQGLGTVRDICESLHLAGAEPEGVTYAEVDAGGVPAMWAVPEGAGTEHALIHFHMGGTVVASMHSDRKAAGHIAKAAGVCSLVVDFRRSPENPYPAQVDDAVAAFDWLVSQGHQPANIGSVGHSVGGFLAAMLALTLRDQGKEQPGAIVSISPWCDLEISNDDIVGKAESDKLLTKPLLELFRLCWLGGTDISFTDPASACCTPTSPGWRRPACTGASPRSSRARPSCSGSAWSTPGSTSRSTRWPRGSTPSSSPGGGSRRSTRRSPGWAPGCARSSG